MIPLFVALPLTAALLLPLLMRIDARCGAWVAGATVAALLAMAVRSIGADAIYHMGGWPTPLGIDLRLDALAALLLVTVNGIAVVACLYAVDYLRGRDVDFHYHSLLLLMIAGANGVVLAGDLFNLYVLLEITVIASYALVAFNGDQDALEAAFKYAVMGTVSSTMILIGVAIFYAITGTLNMSDVASRVSAIGLDGPLLLGAALMLSGFAVKAGLVPFHAWLPDAYPSAPSPVSALLAGVVSKAIGIYVLARVLYNVLGAPSELLEALRWLGALSMVLGALLATAQWDMKRLLAYSSISQAGYIVLGLGLGTSLGCVGALFHLVNHATVKSLLFLNAGAVERAAGTRDLRRLGGLGGILPTTGTTSLVAAMSIAGIPPFNGFWSKLIIILACFEAGSVGLAVLAAVVSIVTLAYQLKLQHHVFLAAAPAAIAHAAATSAREPTLMAVAMIVLALACGALSLLVLGGLEQPLLIAPAGSALLAGPFTL